MRSLEKTMDASQSASSVGRVALPNANDLDGRCSTIGHAHACLPSRPFECEQ